MFTMLEGKPPFEAIGPRPVQHTLENVVAANYRIGNGWSDEATDLLNRLLQKDPNTRATLEEAASHPFFAGTQEVLGAPVGDS